MKKIALLFLASMILAGCAGSVSPDSSLAGFSVSRTAGSKKAETKAWQVIAGPGTRKGQVNAPTYLAVDTTGNVYVSDTGNHRIVKLSSNGEPLAQWGTWGSGPGQFLSPSGIALDHKGSLYVAESGTSENSRIQKLMFR